MGAVHIQFKRHRFRVEHVGVGKIHPLAMHIAAAYEPQ